MKSLKITLIILLFLMANNSLASESAYTPTQRFVPLPPPTANERQQPIVTPPNKFFPLTQSRYPMPIRNDVKIKMAVKNEPSQLEPTKIFSKNTANMSQEQAEQLISIFSSTK
jgi:hypothetical protein